MTYDASRISVAISGRKDGERTAAIGSTRLTALMLKKCYQLGGTTTTTTSVSTTTLSPSGYQIYSDDGRNFVVKTITAQV
jgi:hypothetical protein